jgi:hypothetical protein
MQCHSPSLCITRLPIHHAWATSKWRAKASEHRKNDLFQRWLRQIFQTVIYTNHFSWWNPGESDHISNKTCKNLRIWDPSYFKIHSSFSDSACRVKVLFVELNTREATAVRIVKRKSVLKSENLSIKVFFHSPKRVNPSQVIFLVSVSWNSTPSHLFLASPIRLFFE